MFSSEFESQGGETMTPTTMRPRTIVSALIILAALIAAGSALAAAKPIGGFVLTSSGRAWDLTNSPGSSFSPVDDGQLVAGRFGEDAFDVGLVFSVGGSTFSDSDGVGDFSKRANSFVVGPELTGDVAVTRTETAKGPYLRSLIKLANPDATPFTGSVDWFSNLGSDGDEVTQDSSSGDESFTVADRWVVSSEPGANGPEDDPTLTFVLYGKGADQRVDTIVDGPGTGDLDVAFADVTVPANGTRFLLFYTEMNPKPKPASNSAEKYDARHLSASLLAGISKNVRKRILNWDL
jgi:hypothetical protein